MDEAVGSAVPGVAQEGADEGFRRQFAPLSGWDVDKGPAAENTKA
jgi:hypothetical protein